jgi:hypothetical protein
MFLLWSILAMEFSDSNLLQLIQFSKMQILYTSLLLKKWATNAVTSSS